jgi:hypothetical protein
MPVARWFVVFVCALAALYFLGAVVKELEMGNTRIAAERGVLLALLALACVVTVVAL